MDDVKHIFDKNLHGHDYHKARGLSPEVVKDRQHHCETCARNEVAPNVVRMINGWPIDDELRFVGAI